MYRLLKLLGVETALTFSCCQSFKRRKNRQPIVLHFDLTTKARFELTLFLLNCHTLRNKQKLILQRFTYIFCKMYVQILYLLSET